MQPLGHVDLDGLGLDALAALEKVFDGIRGAARAARLYKRLVDAAAVELPEDIPGIERAIRQATGKTLPPALRRDLPNLNPMTCWTLEGALCSLIANALEAREAGRR